ncbi:MAG: hypothetical protein ABII02_03575 [Candidatus Magasanikbacteria bacterium]
MATTNPNPKEIPVLDFNTSQAAPVEAVPPLISPISETTLPLSETIPEISRPEVQRVPEVSPEIDPSVQKVETIDQGIDSLRKKLRRTKKKKLTAVPQVRDEITMKVEKIMEDGLADAFKELTPVQQQEFKIKGEETAFKIRAILSSAKGKVKSIFKLLLEWLKILPGINIFFLEQEAKIRADKIMSLKNQYFPKK